MMELKGLLEELRKRCNNKSINFPSGIKFEYYEQDKTLKLQMKEGIVKNLQKDDAAFEAWVLVCKANLPDLIDYVILDWDKSYEPIEKSECEWRHFNRFIFRLDHFKNQYGDWFKIANPENENRWGDLIKTQGWTKLILNKSSDDRSDGSNNELDLKLEKHLEEYFRGKGSNKLISKIKEYDIEVTEIKNQLPVGLFHDKVEQKNYIFTGGKSAIDLYSEGVEYKSFNIFELKAESNVKVGIISETFFYASIIKDAIDGIIEWEYSDKIKGVDVNAFFLVSKMHPLITEEVIKLLNVHNNGITYRKIIYPLK